MLLALHLETSSKDVGWATACSRVDWALVNCNNLLELSSDGRDVNDGHDWMELLELHVHKVTLFVTTSHFPASTFEVEASDIGTRGCEGREVFWGEGVLDFGPEADIIERQALGTGSCLHDGRQVSHGVEESRDPKDRWCLNLFSPICELSDTDEKFGKPGLEVLLGWVSRGNPFRWKHVDLEGDSEELHGISDVKSTI